MGATLSKQTGKRSSKIGTRMYPYEPALAVRRNQPNFSSEDEWIKYMKMNVDAQNPPAYDHKLMILKPPQHLFEVKPESYYPKLVTIGPLYQNLQKSPIDRCKALCMKKFMARYAISRQELIDLLIPQSQDLRNIYIELPTYNFDFLKLLVTIDTVFIHEFLCYQRNNFDRNPQPSDSSSSYFSTFYIDGHTLPLRLSRDLLLIGNQIPMSFLKKISDNEDFSLTDLKNTVMSLIMKQNPFFSHGQSSYRGKAFKTDLIECQHLLDSLYVSCTEKFEESDSHQVSVNDSSSETSEESNAGEAKHRRLPPASELSKAGISFKGCKGNISVMKYDKAKLQLDLPELVVYDSTEDVLRSLIAHEQTSKQQKDFTMYAKMMDMLIDTEEDLVILTKAKVIENHLGNGERLVDMWNDMCTGINVEDSLHGQWEEMIHDIVGHHSSRWRRWYAEFRAKYFSRPWLPISILAAFILLSASILQTFYAISSYYKTDNQSKPKP